MDKKLLKVTLEFEDEIKTLEGKEADEWIKLIDNMCVFAQHRNQNPFEHIKFNWNVKSKSACFIKLPDGEYPIRFDKGPSSKFITERGCWVWDNFYFISDSEHLDDIFGDFDIIKNDKIFSFKNSQIRKELCEKPRGFRFKYSINIGDFYIY